MAGIKYPLPRAAKSWKIAEAKASFSELVRDAAKGPQRIENRGHEVAVLLGIDEYLRLREVAKEAGGEARVQRFLELSAEVRRRGGADIELPPREARPSPWASDERESDAPRERARSKRASS